MNDVSNALDLVLGDGYTCVLGADHKVSCSGSSEAGTSSLPGTLTSVDEIGGGNLHTCARTSDGKVYCWGRPLYRAASATNVPLPGPATALGVGGAAACAVIAGRAHCWGFWFYECLMQDCGNPPRQLDGVENVRDIAVESIYLAALNDDGGVTGIGSWLGVLSAGSTGRIRELADVARLELGMAHACLLLKSGELQCLGDNAKGQLGNDSVTQTSTPVPVKL